MDIFPWDLLQVLRVKDGHGPMGPVAWSQWEKDGHLPMGSVSRSHEVKMDTVPWNLLQGLLGERWTPSHGVFWVKDGHLPMGYVAWSLG